MIDNCPHSFEELALEVLPRHFRRLQGAIRNPYPAELFVGPKSATKEIKSRVSRSKDLRGCYVFIKDSIPIYVGISRSVLNRIVQHLNSNSHFSASLAYRKARANHPHPFTRKKAMENIEFRLEFFKRQKYLHSSELAFIEIENDLELYLFEAYATIELDTNTWNKFRTH